MQSAPPGAVRPKKLNPFQHNEEKRDLQRSYQEKKERLKLLPEAFQAAIAQEANAKKEFARIERYAYVFLLALHCLQLLEPVNGLIIVTNRGPRTKMFPWNL